MQEFLSEQEIEKVELFCKDEVMFEAVKKVLLKSLYTSGVLKPDHKHNPLMNAALGMASISSDNPVPNEMIGAQVRAMWEGINALELGYNDLLKIKSKTEEPIETPYNEAV